MVPIPQDKYGKPIYSKPFSDIVNNSKILTKQGYKESYKKPNLFYKKIPEGWLYADMRSSEVIPIWKDTRPLFYWKFNDNIPRWQRRRIIKQELISNMKEGCPCRLSFYNYRTEEFSEVSVYRNEEEGIYEWHDGYCLYCKKDLQSEELFCNDICKKGYEDTFKNECQICKTKINWNEEVGHHLNYAEDITITVCPSCHAKIHFSEDEEYKEYKPIDKRPKVERKYKLVPCSGCEGKTRVLIDEYEEDEEYTCYKCKLKEEREHNNPWNKAFWVDYYRKHGL